MILIHHIKYIFANNKIKETIVYKWHVKLVIIKCIIGWGAYLFLHTLHNIYYAYSVG